MSLITSLICNWARTVTCAEFPYVSADNAAAGQALLVGFVEPIKTADTHRAKIYDLTPEHGSAAHKSTLSPAQKDVVIVATEDAEAKSGSSNND